MNIEKTFQGQEMPTIALASEGIKLTKTTRGYTWEIKITNLDIELLSKLDLELRERFGSEE